MKSATIDRSFITIIEPNRIESSFLNEAKSKIVSLYDIQGRKLENVLPGTLVIELYSDGKKEKLRIVD